MWGYVQIHDGNYRESDTMGTFCGNVIPKPLKSIGRYMYISFHLRFVRYTTPGIQGHIQSCDQAIL